MLVVEGGNKAARKLYGKLGYREQWKETVGALSVGADGRVETGTEVTAVTMRKSLKGGLAGLLGL